MKIIGITGNSGVGKTTISKRLSEKLHCPYIDVDKPLLGSELLEGKNKTPNYANLKPEHFKLLIDSLEDANSPFSILINGLVEKEFEKLSQDNNIIIVEWMMLPYLNIWNNCDIKVLITANENFRKNNSLNSNLISENEYDECFRIVKVEYDNFSYDYIFDNKYDEASIIEILEKF